VRQLVVALVRPLPRVPRDVADHLAHVRRIVLGQIGLVRTQDLHDAPAAGVAGRLVVAVLLSDRPALVGPQPVLESLRRHTDRVPELVPDVVDGGIGVGHLAPQVRGIRTLLQTPLPAGQRDDTGRPPVGYRDAP